MWFPRKNNKIVIQSLSIPIPVYINIDYKIVMKTEYQQQMNAMMEVLTTFTGAPSVFKIENAGNKYEAFMEPGYSINNNFELGLEERRFETSITTMVLGYLIGAGKNQKTPNVVIRESAAKIKIQRERSIVGDIPEFRKGSKDKYRP